ncbi:MAG: amino acid--tRNA ligase-related protein [Gemmataceae bacterium]
MRIALELPLKKLLVGGLEKVYEIGRVFRHKDQQRSTTRVHDALELYAAYGDLFSIMELTEEAIVAVRRFARRRPRTLPYGDRTVNCEPPFQRLKYADLIREHAGCDMFDKEAVRGAAVTAGVKLELRDGRQKAVIAVKEHDVLVHELFEHKVKPALAKLDRARVRVRLPGSGCVRSRSGSATTPRSRSGSSCTCSAWNWRTPTRN